MKVVWLTMVFLLVAVTLAACGPSTTTTSTPTARPTLEAKVSGTVTYLEKIALPKGSIVEVKLLDISKQDVPAVSIGEQVITTSGQQVPFSFEIKYNPTTIDPRYTYAIRARITVDGKLWFTSDTAYPVITRGNPSTVEIVLKKVTTPASEPALENTTWILESYGQPGNLKSVLKDTEVTALFDSAKGQVEGSAGVNRYFGAYKLDGNKLVIPGPTGSTAMAGPQTFMDQEKEYLSALQATENYKIDGGKLTITCGGKILIFRKK